MTTEGEAPSPPLPVTQELLPAIQADRDAAADYLLATFVHERGTKKLAAVYRRGGPGTDATILVQAFARHRTRSTPLAEHGEYAELVRRLREMASCSRPNSCLCGGDTPAVRAGCGYCDGDATGPEAATAISALEANTQRLLAGWNEAEERLGSANALARATGEQLDYANRQIKALEAEVGRLREGLRPFAKAAMGVETFDPDFPMDGAALRASFDWYDKCQSEPLKRHSVRRSDLERARRLIEGEGI